MAELSQASTTTTVTVKRYADVTYKTVGSLSINLDVYVPQGPGMSGPFPALLMIHGGGWADGSKSDLKSYAQDFAAMGFVAYVPDFRESCDPLNPAPGDPPQLCGYIFPTHLEDLRDALLFIRQNAPLHPEWKTMADRVAAWGTSSGGNLAGNLGTGWTACNCPEGTPGWDKPDAMVSWSGPMDLVNGGGNSAVPDRGYAYLGCYPPPAPSGYESQECPLQTMEDISPLYNVTPDDPPTFLMQATNDPLLPISEHAIPMYDALQAAGVPSELYEVQGTCHGLKCTTVDPTLEQNNAVWLHSFLGPNQPTVPITSGPDNPTQLAQATFQFSPGSGVTTTCGLDGAPLALCTSPVNFSGLAPGLHSFTVQGTDASGTGDPSIYYWTIAPAAVTVLNTSFSPQSVSAKKGGWVQWSFNGTKSHTVTDSSGMGLFDSGPVAPGGTFRQLFLAAGKYNYRSTLDTGMTGTVQIPLTAWPQIGPPNTNFTITWASDTAPSGYVYDVQSKLPGATSWANWKMNQTVGQATTTISTEGTYTYRARMKNSAAGKASAWSGGTSLTVTTADTTPPNVTITSKPTSPTTSNSATLTYTADEPATFTCSLDGGPYQSCPGNGVTYTGLAWGWHLFGVKGTDTSGNVSTPATTSWYVSQTASIGISDSGYQPQTATVAFGTTVHWTNSGASQHTVTDSSAVALFDSGPLGPGSTFQFFFLGASTYHYHSTLDASMDGTIKVPPKVTPAGGTTITTFTVAWAAMAPPSNLMFDVYIKRPGATGFALWQLGDTNTSEPFVPDAGAGTYSFLVRLRNVADVVEDFSPAVSISVTP